MRTKNFLRLRGAVASKGLTLTDLAAHLDISQQSLNERLHGRKQFTLAEMIKTCNHLEAPVDIFFDPDLHNLQFTKLTNAQ